VRINISVEPQLYGRLTDLARRRSVPLSQVVGEALARYVSDGEALLPADPLPDWVGMLEGPGGEYASWDEVNLSRGLADLMDPTTPVDGGAVHDAGAATAARLARLRRYATWGDEDLAEFSASLEGQRSVQRPE
jgi:hypothetical protein